MVNGEEVTKFGKCLKTITFLEETAFDKMRVIVLHDQPLFVKHVRKYLK